MTDFSAMVATAGTQFPSAVDTPSRKRAQHTSDDQTVSGIDSGDWPLPMSSSSSFPFLDPENLYTFSAATQMAEGERKKQQKKKT